MNPMNMNGLNKKEKNKVIKKADMKFHPRKGKDHKINFYIHGIKT